MTGIVGGIGVGASRQQQTDDLGLVLSHGQHQGRAARLVTRIDDRSLIEQLSSLCHVALGDGRL